jgi:membrane-associated phospholipid phosphatase
MRDSIRAGARAAAGPILGLVLTYVLIAFTSWGRRFEALAFAGRQGTGPTVRSADLLLLETISTATVLLAVVALVVVGLLRGRWQLALRNTVAVLGAVVSAEVLKYTLPSRNQWSGQWQWASTGSFPSGHAVIVTSIALAVLSVSPDAWRRLLVGPLVACTSIATTATVTVGWHRPGDVIGSFFLATAWHRALTARQRGDRRHPITVPTGWTLVCWGPAAGLVLGAAVDGVRTNLAASGRQTAASYLIALTFLLVGALITIVVPPRPDPRPAPARSEPVLLKMGV